MNSAKANEYVISVDRFDTSAHFRAGVFMRFILILLTLLVSAQLWAQQYIDLSRTLFGVEYTFQDREIVNEPGRMTMQTPYKKEKMNQMVQAYLRLKNLPESSLSTKPGFKSGYFIQVNPMDQYVINMEPVTIEFNTTPKKLNEIKAEAEPIYAAAAEAGLKPYVNPAAERSGMGHIHVGGARLSDSPFYRHENLLRNVLAFFHKHPSLLYGFAEAYDVGTNSNIETFHNEDMQNALEKVFNNYDKWAQTRLSTDSTNGLLKLVSLFKASTDPVAWSSSSYGWFAHYKVINMEHIQGLSENEDPNSTGKRTVEFRGFRPPPSPAHAEAAAQLLVAVMDYLARPDHLEKFERVTQNELALFFTGSRVQDDWEKVKKILKLQNPLLDEMVHEYVEAIHNKKILQDANKGIEIFESYSEKENKGKRFEIRLNGEKFEKAPKWKIKETEIKFFEVTLEGKKYWIASVDPKALGASLEEFKLSPMKQIELSPKPLVRPTVSGRMTSSGVSVKQCNRLIEMAL